MGARIAAALSWIASVSLALLAAVAFTITTDTPVWYAYVAGICMAAAAIMLFPPLWNAQAGETVLRRRVRVTVAVLLALVGLFLPVQTHAVKLDMPAASHP